MGAALTKPNVQTSSHEAEPAPPVPRLRRVSTASARGGLADMVRQAAVDGARFVLTKYGKDQVLVCPASDMDVIFAASDLGLSAEDLRHLVKCREYLNSLSLYEFISSRDDLSKTYDWKSIRKGGEGAAFHDEGVGEESENDGG